MLRGYSNNVFPNLTGLFRSILHLLVLRQKDPYRLLNAKQTENQFSKKEIYLSEVATIPEFHKTVWSLHIQLPIQDSPGKSQVRFES